MFKLLATLFVQQMRGNGATSLGGSQEHSFFLLFVLYKNMNCIFNFSLHNVHKVNYITCINVDLIAFHKVTKIMKYTHSYTNVDLTGFAAYV